MSRSRETGAGEIADGLKSKQRQSYESSDCFNMTSTFQGSSNLHSNIEAMNFFLIV